MNVERMLDKAANVAIKRLHDARTFFVGAVGVRSDGVVVHARNESAHVPTPHLHAEARITKKLGLNAPVVYVARWSFGKGGWAMAKPCPTCMSMLRSHRVKRVIYTTGINSYEEMEIR